ncbi:MAG: TIGR02186 family protein, partial [Marivivens sp.]|nr:TIGR02186 family protein [Marivivens sp.]
TTEFSEAFARIKESSDLFQMLEGAVALEDDTLFHTAITLPSNLTEGPYRTRIFLTRGGQVIDTLDTNIPVFKVGMERWLYNLSREQSALYGLLALLIAIIAGWTASAAFNAMRR